MMRARAFCARLSFPINYWSNFNGQSHGERQASTLQLQQEEELAPAVDLQQRDREITEIARSIAQLAELFKDLSALVIDQGTLLDSVEYNIEQTAVEMQEAVTELKIAEGYVFLRTVCLFVWLLVCLFVCLRSPRILDFCGVRRLMCIFEDVRMVCSSIHWMHMDDGLDFLAAPLSSLRS